ncbi:hypothetical protein [Streptomyces sp. KL116D]|uniref:hypothetical protein n=1 Tax=Streptomyces sp. KL116D TaxID=3045152 RepID=UPI003555F5D3
MHNTGEGGLSEYHRSGGDLVLQIGTSYFGCRNDDGTFKPRQAQGRGRGRPAKWHWRSSCPRAPKPGLGGMLPGAKVTPRSPASAASRWARTAPSRHSAFHDVDSMLDFVELLATETGLPADQERRGRHGLLGGAGHADGAG